MHVHCFEKKKINRQEHCQIAMSRFQLLSAYCGND